MNFLYEIFGTLLSLLYDVYNSFGFTIIGLTMLVMIIVTPLTLKGTRSMLMMQQLQPELKKLQSRYKDDRQKLNEEMLKLYKENNINPVGGCLPLLIQMPVFFVLYNVLRGLTLRVTTIGSNVGSVVGQQGAGSNVGKPPDVSTLHMFDPQFLPSGSKLGDALHGTNEMRSLGLDLAQSASETFSKSLVLSLPYLLLIAIVAVTGFIQQRQIQGRNPNAQINPQQQQIMKIMPIFLPIFSFALPSGLVLYFAISNLYRVGQQWFISRSMYGEGKLGDTVNKMKSESSDKAAPAATGMLAKARERAAAGSKPAITAKEAKSSGSKEAKGSGRVTAPKTVPAKPKGNATAPRADRSGRDRTSTTASDNDKHQGNSRSNSGANASGRGTKPAKAAPTKGELASPPPPTLQPRARKNKKR